MPKSKGSYLLYFMVAPPGKTVSLPLALFYILIKRTALPNGKRNKQAWSQVGQNATSILLHLAGHQANLGRAHKPPGLMARKDEKDKGSGPSG